MFDSSIGSMYELLKRFPDEQSCIDYLEYIRWNCVVVSPFDSDSKVYKCGNNKYRCKNTGKYFNVKTGTMYENTKIKFQKWFLAIWLITSHKRGISSLQLSRDIDVTQKTAWFMLQRIRACFGVENYNCLSEIVECDETFIGGKNKNRHKNKKVKNSQGRSFKDKTPVLGMLQRKGKMTAIVVANTQKVTIQPLLNEFIKSDSKVISDEWSAYQGIGVKYDHRIIDHSKKEYVNLNDNTIHTNSIEGSWKILKGAVSGTYNHVSRKHLQKYVDEFIFRYNLRNSDDGKKFNHLICNSNVRTKYKELTQ